LESAAIDRPEVSNTRAAILPTRVFIKQLNKTIHPGFFSALESAENIDGLRPVRSRNAVPFSEQALRARLNHGGQAGLAQADL
jgi:hypothetical protein